MNAFKVIVSAIIFNQKGEVLLGQRSPHEDVFPNLWGIPGGKIEAEVNSVDVVEATLIREAKEEMGIDIEPEHYIESSCRIAGDEAKLYLIYTAKWIGGEPQALEDTQKVRWFPVNELKKLDLTPHTYDHIIDARRRYF